mmetsp:Transcript_23428/g.45712  ORF Transcript_23428/g.45712 Transcript_23428/m.45712 type:complete len:277 (-) Transcript_23428:121-951(-)
MLLTRQGRLACLEGGGKCAPSHAHGYSFPISSIWHASHVSVQLAGVLHDPVIEARIVSKRVPQGLDLAGIHILHGVVVDRHLKLDSHGPYLLEERKRHIHSLLRVYCDKVDDKRESMGGILRRRSSAQHDAVNLVVLVSPQNELGRIFGVAPLFRVRVLDASRPDHDFREHLLELHRGLAIVPAPLLRDLERRHLREEIHPIRAILPSAVLLLDGGRGGRLLHCGRRWRGGDHGRDRASALAPPGSNPPEQLRGEVALAGYVSQPRGAHVLPASRP